MEKGDLKKKAEKEKEKKKRGRPSLKESQAPDTTSAPITPAQKELLENGMKLPDVSTLTTPARPSQTPRGKQPAALPEVTQAMIDEAMQDCKIIEKYHQRFPEILGRFQPINLAKTHPLEVRAMKYQCFKACDRQFGPMLAKSGLVGVATLFEWVWMTYCFNHPALGPYRAKFNLTDLGNVIGSDQAMVVMEPLLDEWQMRYPSIFEQPLWVRTLHGLYLVCKEVAEMNRGRPSHADAGPSGYEDL